MTLRTCFILTICMLMLMLAAPFSAHAQTPPTTVTSNLNQNKLFAFENKVTACLHIPPAGKGITPKEWVFDKYTGRLMYCMRQLVNETTKAFLKTLVSEYALGIVAATFIFAIGMFGVKLTFGMLRNLKSEGFTFVFKLGLIWGLLSNTDFLVDFWFDSVDMLVEVLVGGFNGVFPPNLTCPVSNNSMQAWFVVWDRFDCLFGKFVGFGTDVAAGTGVIAAMGMLFVSGGFAVWIMFMMFGALVAMAQFLFKAAMMTLLSYGGLGLMLLMLPLFLPLLLFKQTEDFITKAWLPYAISFVIQPAITITFLMFSLNVMDAVIMGGSSTTYVRYNAGTQSTEVKNFTGAPDAGFEPAVLTLNEIRNIDVFGTKAEQEAAIKTTTKTTQIKASEAIQASINQNSYKDGTDCGKLGSHNLSSTTISSKVSNLGSNAFVGVCTDPAKCRQAAAQNFAGAPSDGSKNTARNTLCAVGRLNADGTVLNGVASSNGSTTNLTTNVETLELNYQSGQYGSVAAGQTPNAIDLTAKRLMQILGYVGMVILTSATFFNMMEYVPQLTRKISGSGGLKLALSSPHVLGKKLSERLDAGVKGANEAATKSRKKDEADGGGKTSRLKKVGNMAMKFGGGILTGRK